MFNIDNRPESTASDRITDNHIRKGPNRSDPIEITAKKKESSNPHS